jgi:transglutaminase-like putative cysteine protease
MNVVIARLPMRMLLAAFGAGCLLHVDRVPAWCTAVAAAALLWRWLAFHGRVALPGKALRIGIAMLLVFAVLVTFRTIGGLAAGSALLVVLGAAKLLETRGQRDAVVLATVSLILVLAAALDRQDLARLPLYVATGWLALAGIAALGNVRAAASARRAFLTAGRTALYAIPLAALCFVLVPRLPGALWSMPGAGRSETGLSDEMSPGSISELSISDEIAFRVRFDGPAPPPPQRYWRGPVLHDFDGYTWRRTQQYPRSQEAEPLSPPVRYHVMLEPHGGRFLFVLDTFEKIEGIAYNQLFDGEVQAWRRITGPTSYDGISALEARSAGELSTNGRRVDTRLPPGRNPRSVALARAMRAAAESDADYARRVMEYFGSGGFEYTLTPPLLDLDSIDDLLFNTRLGFCGHFASAFVMLMRAADVPARVVTGYQGGIWNPVGGYYTVRQSDAHAWAEVWLEGQGWTRFDPTGVVSPARLQRGAANAIDAGLATGNALFGEVSWLRGLRDAWEAAGGWWQEQIVNFNRAKQLDLLKLLRLDNIDYGGMVLLLLAGGVLWALLLMALLKHREPRARRDGLARLWERFARLLRRRGIEVADCDGPDAVRRRAVGLLPQASGEIDAFAAWRHSRCCSGRVFAPQRVPVARSIGHRPDDHPRDEDEQQQHEDVEPLRPGRRHVEGFRGQMRHAGPHEGTHDGGEPSHHAIQAVELADAVGRRQAQHQRAIGTPRAAYGHARQHAHCEQHSDRQREQAC